MSHQSANELDELDTASTARLSIRTTVLAQIEAALLAQKLAVTEVHAKAKGIDPYNKAVPKPDTWANYR